MPDSVGTGPDEPHNNPVPSATSRRSMEPQKSRRVQSQTEDGPYLNPHRQVGWPVVGSATFPHPRAKIGTPSSTTTQHDVTTVLQVFLYLYNTSSAAPEDAVNL